MATIRVEKKSYYTVLSNVPLQKDTRLSAKAKGMLAVMLSFPDDWSWNAEALKNYFTDGRDAIRAGLKELEKCGYLVREIKQDKKGKFDGTSYVLYEEPQDRENRAAIGLEEPLKKSIPVRPKEEEEEVKDKTPSHAEEIKEIIGFLNLTLGTGYKTNSKATNSLINARLNEGFTVDNFKTVIWKKSRQWINDPKMAGYLRPKTLFGTNFEGYLNEIDMGIIPESNTSTGEESWF